MLYALMLAQQPAQEGPPWWSSLPMLIMIGFLFYFLLIRPVQRQERDRKAMVAQLRKNAKVVTTAGIVGTIVRIKDDEELVLLKLHDGKMEVLKSSIHRALTSGDSKESTEPEEADERIKDG